MALEKFSVLKEDMREDRILVVGVSAVGKSTFARRLAEKTKLPLTHMDMIMWQPSWNYVGDEITALKVREVIATPHWILEGFLEKSLIPEVLNACDLILYLDYSRWVLFFRYVKRSWQHRRNARPEMPGCPDQFSLKFLLRILQKREAYWLNKKLESGAYDKKLRVLRRPIETDDLFDLI
jgi:adenylate kinase family enzyme